jgi:hypothetical protein
MQEAALLFAHKFYATVVHPGNKKRVQDTGKEELV